MYERLITAGGESRQPLLPLAGGLSVLVVLLATMPWVFDHLDAARAYVDPQAKRLFFGFGIAVMLASIVAGLVQFAIGLGLVASVYGRTKSTTAYLTSPWGLVGVPRQKLELHPGVATIHLWNDPAKRPLYAYGPQRIWITQDDRKLRILSLVTYAPGSRERLVRWLGARGVAVVFEGEQGVLSDGKVPRRDDG